MYSDLRQVLPQSAILHTLMREMYGQKIQGCPSVQGYTEHATSREQQWADGSQDVVQAIMQGQPTHLAWFMGHLYRRWDSPAQCPSQNSGWRERRSSPAKLLLITEPKKPKEWRQMVWRGPWAIAYFGHYQTKLTFTWTILVHLFWEDNGKCPLFCNFNTSRQLLGILHREQSLFYLC